MKSPLLTVLLALLSQHLLLPVAGAESIFLDAVVASIDDKPITLNEVSRHLNPPRKLTLQQAAESAEFGRALDMVILDTLVQAEAQQRKLSVFDEEVSEYLKEIAKRNNLSEADFFEALRREGRSESEYREQVKRDILRSKLAASLSRGAVAVSDAEVDKAVKERRGDRKAGVTVTLRQILIGTAGRGQDAAEERMAEVREKLDDGEKFDDLARQYSDSPDGEDGGSLGTMSEADLAAVIRDAIQDLDTGDISDVVTTDQGLHLFMLEERTAPEEDEEEESVDISAEEREQIRNALKQKRLESKMTEFFTTELYKLHSVDKKI